MSITVPVVSAKIPGLTGGDYTLNVKSSRIALDENRVPYGEADLVVALPPLSVLAQITPYASLRVQVTVTQSWLIPVRAAQTRTFDFLLHERNVNHLDATLAIRVVTDEAMLLDRLNTSTTLARSYGLSVKTAVEYALTQIGATLEAGAVDATLTSKALEATRTNLLVNRSAETNTTNAAVFNCTLSRVNTWSKWGSWAFQLASPTTNDSCLYIGGDSGAIRNGMVAGKTYTVSGTIRLAAALTGSEFAARARGITVHYGTSGSYTVVTSPQAPNAAGEYRLSLTFTIPSTATEAWVRFYNGHTGGTVQWDGLMLTEGSDLLPYFDGSTTGGNDAGLYSTAWTGTAHASTSTLTNLPNTDATIWRPGQSLDEWLAPILQAANRRLFCDEKRKWRLVDASYALDGVVTISEGFNAKTGSDTMSRQKTEGGVPVWFDHVAVHYRWTDAAGVVQEKWDFAGTGTVKGFLVELTTPWPGPGAAMAILARANGRGRTQDVTALTDYAANPGMPIVTTLPGTPVQSGVTSSVEWIWDDDLDEMSVGSRGLTTTPADAWILDSGPWNTAGGTWNVPT